MNEKVKLNEEDKVNFRKRIEELAEKWPEKNGLTHINISLLQELIFEITYGKKLIVWSGTS